MFQWLQVKIQPGLIIHTSRLEMLRVSMSFLWRIIIAAQLQGTHSHIMTVWNSQRLIKIMTKLIIHALRVVKVLIGIIVARELILLGFIELLLNQGGLIGLLLKVIRFRLIVLNTCFAQRTSAHLIYVSLMLQLSTYVLAAKKSQQKRWLEMIYCVYQSAWSMSMM